MLSIFSWRWSQLLRRSAVKRFFTHVDQIFILMIFEGLLLGMFIQNEPQLLTSRPFWHIAGVLFLFAILMVICTADNYYEIKSENKIKYYIYLYKAGIYSRNKNLEMIILNEKKEYQIHAEILPDYTFYSWWNLSSFLFYPTNDKCWFYVSTLDDISPLGYRIGQTVFSIPGQPNKIKVLDDYSTKLLSEDTFFLNGTYLPSSAEENIHDVDTGEILSPPQDYLIAKRGKKYTVYGLYYEDVPAPSCRVLSIPNIIFKEGAQEVLLQWNDDRYIEVYRTHGSAKREVSDTFVELTFPNGIGGTVKRFNEKTGKLDLIYKGYFHAIDFNSGAVLGDNFEYDPTL